jgi:hypothetical protein
MSPLSGQSWALTNLGWNDYYTPCIWYANTPVVDGVWFGIELSWGVRNPPGAFWILGITRYEECPGSNCKFCWLAYISQTGIACRPQDATWTLYYCNDTECEGLCDVAPNPLPAPITPDPSPPPPPEVPPDPPDEDPDDYPDGYVDDDDDDRPWIDDKDNDQWIPAVLEAWYCANTGDCILGEDLETGDIVLNGPFGSEADCGEHCVICPTDCSGCAETYYAYVDSYECGSGIPYGYNGVAMGRTGGGGACHWVGTNLTLTCTTGHWRLVTYWPGECHFARVAMGVGDCPAGNYLLASSDCTDCPIDADVYS